MTEGTTAPVSSVQSVTATTPKKQKKSTKGKSTHAASHPKYSDMIKAALKALNERGGSSRAAILKYVLAHYSLDPIQANQHLKSALKNGVKSKNFKQTKGNGASGSFKLADAAKKPAKKDQQNQKNHHQLPQLEQKNVLVQNLLEQNPLKRSLQLVQIIQL